MSYIYPVILSGGVGSRLWPLSRSQFPKQFLALAGERSLIQETALRVTGPAFAKVSIICHADHSFLVTEQMRAIGVQPARIFLEPTGRNTAPATAVTALAIAQNDPDATLLLMPADHVIGDPTAFLDAIATAREQAEQGYLVTFGIHPRGPDTGYGYIQRGTSLREDNKAFAVVRFVEKPDLQTAESYIRAGDYYWNSGLFLFQARAYLSELERVDPDTVALCRQAIQNGKQEANYFRLAQKPFGSCKSISIDYAVMEHTDKAAIVPVEMGWSDIGSWPALWDMSDKDAEGNVVRGDVLHQDTRNSYLRSDGPLLAVVGMKELVVVASRDAVLVGSKSTVQDIKKIVAQLEQQDRDLRVVRPTINHSWGRSARIGGEDGFEVIHIVVNPGEKVETEGYQAGRWVITSGNAKISRDGETFHLRKTESWTPTAGPLRLENPGDAPLHIIEIRTIPGRNET